MIKQRSDKEKEAMLQEEFDKLKTEVDDKKFTAETPAVPSPAQTPAFPTNILGRRQSTILE